MNDDTLFDDPPGLSAEEIERNRAESEASEAAYEAQQARERERFNEVMANAFPPQVPTDVLLERASRRSLAEMPRPFVKVAKPVVAEPKPEPKPEPKQPSAEELEAQYYRDAIAEIAKARGQDATALL